MDIATTIIACFLNENILLIGVKLMVLGIEGLCLGIDEINWCIV
jgi:hypothetical protein